MSDPFAMRDDEDGPSWSDAVTHQRACGCRMTGDECGADDHYDLIPVPVLGQRDTATIPKRQGDHG